MSTSSEERPRPAGGKRLLLSLAMLLLVLLSAPHQAARGEAGAASSGIEISIRAELVRKLLFAVVPYEVELDAGLFQEVVTLSHPRRVRLVPGGLDLEMTATGAPVPFTAEVSPRVRVEKRTESDGGGWVIAVQELPVNLGRLGTYDLSSFIEPVDVQSVTPYLLATPGDPVPLDLVVESITVTTDDIRIGLGARFPGAPGGQRP